MTPFGERVTTQLMPDKHSTPIPAHVRAWAHTLPAPAADAVGMSDPTLPHIHMRFAAAPDQVGVARAHITAWIRRLGVPTVLEQDIVLATDEAVSNAVEHAYPRGSGALTLFAACVRPDGAVRIVVSDEGRWRPPPANPGFRGRGLAMMERLSPEFQLVHTSHGTTVLLGWPPPRDFSADGSGLAVRRATHDQ